MPHQLYRFKFRTLTVLAASLLTATLAWAVDPFTVRDIRVEGLQRVEPGTIFASIPLRVGEQYNDDKGSAAIRSLFALGLFKDVRIEVTGDVLVVIVEERPTVAGVEFVGSKEFDKDVLKKALREAGLYDGQPFDKALADKAEQELKRQYVNRSLYAVTVVTTVTPIERNRVNLTFSITEGQIAKIKDIRVVGAKDFSESTLRKLFDLDTGGWLSWYTKSDRYSRVKLNADIETLRSYYLSRGYLDFRVDSTQVAISADKQEITVTLNITEGQRFVVSGIRLEGNYLGHEEEFKSLVSIKPGESYNADRVAETTKAFNDYFGTFGFAFSRVEAIPQIDRSTNLVSFVLQADPSRRAYVRRISLVGNNRTRDEVIRREFRQLESSWYDGDNIKRSRDRVDRLGYFTNVAVDTQDVANAPDQVDLVMTVAEKPTGNLSLGMGFSSADKISLMAGIQQENFFGTGHYVGINVNTSKYNRQIVLSTVDPYFTTDGVSRAIDVYSRTNRPYTGQGGDYALLTKGAGIRFGVPFTENDRVFFGTAIEQTTIQDGVTALPVTWALYKQKFGASSTSIPLTLGWSRDKRDSALVPTTGIFQRLNADWGVGGDVKYVRSNYQIQQYIPLNKQFTIGLNGELGWGKGLNGQPFPIFKNFYSGGLGSVRGFAQGSLGPTAKTDSLGNVINPISIGGAKKITLSAELSTPFPGAGNDRTLRMYTFADAGNVYGEYEAYSLAGLRASVGVGISWISPVGPLRLAFGRAIRKQDGDRMQPVQFQIGTSF
jgi:outer membrane protein insertion porin family